MAEMTMKYQPSVANNNSSSFPDIVIEMTSINMVDQRNLTGIEQFAQSYSRIHGYLSVFVCVFGIVSNLLNIIVLTRPHMRTPTNYILTALAIADMLTMSTYPIMAVYLYIVSRPHCYGTRHPKEWIYFVLFHNLFIITCHNMAMWLTVSLAVFRYIFVCMHTRAMSLCSLERAKLTIGLIVVVTIITCIPNYTMYEVVDYGKQTLNESCYFILESQFATDHPKYTQFVKWLYGVVIKILPCILLAFLSTLLIIAMQQAKNRRARLLSKVSRASDHDHQSGEHNRTTMMLVAVVLFFVITELPQGILALISSVNSDFWNTVYINLGDLMDILVLINSAVNFILYCIMSQQFRNTFSSLFVGKNMPFFKSYSKQNGADYSVVKTETTQV